MSSSKPTLSRDFLYTYLMAGKPDMIRGYQKNMGGQAHVHVPDAAGVPLSFSMVLAVRLN